MHVRQDVRRLEVEVERQQGVLDKLLAQKADLLRSRLPGVCTGLGAAPGLKALEVKLLCCIPTLAHLIDCQA